MTSLLSMERRDGVEVLTLQRPDKRNALSIDLRLELADALTRTAEDDGVGCILLTGAGSAFCAGMDTTQFGGDLENRQQLFDSSVACFRALRTCPLPTVAAINGPALAGGFALALLCDIRIASQTANFGYPELAGGIPPGYAATRAALPAQIAAELTLTGELVDPFSALRAGIVSAVYPAETMLPKALALATTIAAAPRAATLVTKRRILLERERNYGYLFEEEEQALRERLLGEQPEPAA